MSGKFVIGLDCSTTNSKAIVFNKKGEIVSSAYEPIKLFSPKLNYYEQDANEWWTSAQTALRKITNQINPTNISALAISNQRETFVTLDKNNNCIGPAIIWLDERCKSEVEQFAKKIGYTKIHRITGKPVDYAPVVYRLAWMKKHEPKLYKKISMIADVHTFLTWKLTGEFKTSWASADPLGMFDLKNKKWSSTILNELKLQNDQLPEAFSPGTILGNISDEASMLTGLSKETLIVAGGGDGQSAGLGSNILKSERAYLNLGTAVVAGVFGNEYKTSKSFRTMGSCSDNGYYYECSLRAGTFTIDWFIKHILKIDPLLQPEIYKQLDIEAYEVSSGADGLLFLPYLCGVMNPYWNSEARGSFVGLSSSHNRGHLYRAILEGIAFEQLFALNSVEDNIGKKVNEIVAIGGGTSSELWIQILADVIGKKILIPKCREASSLGAAINAFVATGCFKSYSDAANCMTGIKNQIKPNVPNHKKYKIIFAGYKKLYPVIQKAGLMSN